MMKKNPDESRDFMDMHITLNKQLTHLQEEHMTNKIETDFKAQALEVNIGIDAKNRKLVCKGLSKLLSDSYLLYLKTQNYHWNVTGPQFQALHLLFEAQYKELAEAVDVIAERIRALGEFAPGSFSAFSKMATIKEESSVPSSEEMIQNLVLGHEAVVTTARETISLTDSCEDDVTADLLVERMQVHEKAAWMLRSLISPDQAH
jgi:starvation-inducible DNA-binding protein